VLGSAIFQHLLVLNPHDHAPFARHIATVPRLARAAGLLALLMGAFSLPARAAPPEGEPVRADLIAEPAAIAPGQPFWVGVRLRMREGWHVYWRNPGDSGEAPTITWQLPPSLAAGPIAWPTPSRIGLAHLVNFGYQGETMLLTRIEPAPALADSLMIGAHVTWLVCDKECIPGEASLSIDLPVAHGQPAAANAATAAAFDAARKDLPQPSPWRARLELGRDQLTLALDGAPRAAFLAASSIPAGVRSAYFFPNAETLVRHAAAQRLRLVGDGLTLQLERSALSTSAPTDAGGVLLLEEGDGTARHAFELANVSIGEAPAPQVASLMAVLNAAVLALLGGAILNLMPCVFPVLSIKVLGLIEQAGACRRQLRRHGLAYTAGVLIAFAALGMGLLGVRAAGAEVGWGFQLQSHLAVLILAYLLFAVGLNLSGTFQLGSSLQGLGHGLARRNGLTGSLFAGVLAAVMATPCTAPFMATALGFAFTQPSPIALSVMLALGLGLALPYLALTHAPRLIPRLPRPGAWMETLRQVLAFPIYATVAWLVWVLAQQVDAAGLFAALAGLVLVGLAAWSFNAAGQAAGRWGRGASRAALLTALLGIAVALAAVGRDREVPAPLDLAAASPQPFTQARLEALIAAHRSVFVNLTAAWCITCLVNEQAALASERVRAAFAAKGITYLKGDWTRRNPEITRLLEKHGRSGVPLYLVFAGETDPVPVVLPQILTPATVLAAIARIPDRGPQRASLPTPTKE